MTTLSAPASQPGVSRDMRSLTRIHSVLYVIGGLAIAAILTMHLSYGRVGQGSGAGMFVPRGQGAAGDGGGQVEDPTDPPRMYE